MTSELLDQISNGIPSDFADPGEDFATTRVKMAPLHGHPLADDTAVLRGKVGGVPCVWLARPLSYPSRGSAIFFHGGAFVSCDAEAYLFYAELIADCMGVPVLTVDYRLAPEHPFPAALDDCLAAYRGLLDAGQSPRRLICIGDSCGGGIALATLQRSRDAGEPLPAGLVSLSGWLDLDTAGYGPVGPRRRDPFITEGFLRSRTRDYLGPEGDPHHPWASPARGQLHGLPPLLLQVGDVDLCRIDAERVGALAGAAGVDVEVDVVVDGVHGVQGLASMGVPEAVQAWTVVRRFTDRVLAR